MLEPGERMTKGAIMTAGPARLEFMLLGPFRVSYDGCALHVGGLQVRAVLARLLVDAGHPVSLSALVDELWGDRAPADASRTVRTYVSRLRTALRNASGDDDPLVTVAPGYRLRVDPDAIDATRFEQLAIAGRTALGTGEPQIAHERLTAALALWRGAALAEFDEFPALCNERRRLDRLRLAVLEDRIDADLAIAGADRIVGVVEDLVAEHPERERL